MLAFVTWNVTGKKPIYLQYTKILVYEMLIVKHGTCVITNETIAMD